MASKIKKGDTVEVIAGKDLGKRGEVLSVDPTKGRVVVQGINQVFKHMRPSRQNPQGGRVHKEMSLDASNVMVVDPKTDKTTRVGFRVNADGIKERYAKKSGESLGLVSKKKS